MYEESKISINFFINLVISCLANTVQTLNRCANTVYILLDEGYRNETRKQLDRAQQNSVCVAVILRENEILTRRSFRYVHILNIY